MKKIYSVIVRLMNSMGFARKKAKTELSDAIQLPHGRNLMVVEDYEMAAFHNQA